MTRGDGRTLRRQLSAGSIRSIIALAIAAVLVVDPYSLANATATVPSAKARTNETRDENFTKAIASLSATKPVKATNVVSGDWQIAESGTLVPAPADVPAATEKSVDIPAGGSTSVELDGVKVDVGTAGDTPAPANIDIHVADAKSTKDAGVTGVVLEVKSDASAGSSVELTVSYASFAGLVNADWASRLQLVRLPDCAGSEQCDPVPLESRNDPIAQTVTAVVPLEESSPAARTGAAQSTATTLAVTASTSPTGPGGNWGATNLSPSSTWGTAGNSGAFTWSYPLDLPGVAAGPAPELSVSYSSAVSDGRTPSSNNQSGWIGEGFDLTSGYIERSYTPCQTDTGAGANNIGLSTGDLCWGKESMTLVFKGSATTLIRDAASGKWYGRTDDGTRIERLTGGWSGGQAGEYWKLTTTDGNQYFFGRGKRSASDTLPQKSAWTVPVYGNHAGESCNQATFANSRCDQVWRWNLDYVLDTSGNSMTYVYETETNNYVPNYGQNTAGTAIPYTSGGRLARIDYGTTNATLTGNAPAQIVFTSAPRCLTDAANGTSLCTTDTASPNTKTWPDTPKDLRCASTSGCLNVTPVFFDTTYLSAMTAQVHDGTAYRKVDRWALGYKFTGEGDGSNIQYATNPILRLETITRTGMGGTDATSDDITLQPIRFGYQFLQNRVDAPNDGVAPLWRPRVIQVITDVGANISVDYRTECSATDLPGSSDTAQQSNNRLCYPVKWAPPGEQVRLDWFHKYVVRSMREDGAAPVSAGSAELVTGSVGKVTTYDYSAPGWAKPTGALVDAATVTYSEFRGAQTVLTTLGEGAAAEKTSTVYFRGLGGAMPAAGPAGAQVTATDVDQFAGQPFATTELNGATPVSTSVTVPGTPVTVATTSAGMTSTRSPSSAVTSFTFRANGALDKQTKTTTTLNASAQIVSVEDLGDLSLGTDDVCTKVDYSADPAFVAANMLAFATKTEKFGATCATVPTVIQLISRDLTTYDAAGRVLTTSALRPDGSGTYQTSQIVSYDSRGRVLQAADAAGKVTTTAYTTGPGGQVTQIAQTTPDPDGAGPVNAFTTTKTFNPVTGWLTETKDQNNKKTTATYDALGRLLTVRYPQHQTTAAPSMAYTYVAQANGLNAVVTKTIAADGTGQDTSVQLMDGLLRPFQTQNENRNAGSANDLTSDQRGRVVTHTFYDSAGRVFKQTGAWQTTGAPSTAPVVAAPSPPSQTTYVYDGAGRATQEILWNGTDSNPAYEVWRTSTTFDGSVTLTIPPTGGVPTEQIVDARGQLIELREHARNPISQASATTAAAVLALPATVTKYDYDPSGNLTKMTDPANNVWSYTFDKTGKQTQAVDPDSGTTTTTYDVLGQVVTRTNGAAKTLAYTYDTLGRPLTVRDNTVTGAVRTQWTYDQSVDASGTTVLGAVTSATRITAAGNAVQSVGKYNDAGDPLEITTTLPNDTTKLQALAGKSYTTKYAYTAGGKPYRTIHPAIANASGTNVVSAETVSTQYDSANMPSLMTGSIGFGVYVARADYDAFGNPTAQDLGSTKGAVVTQAWDPVTGRLTRVAVDREDIDGTEIDLNYTYDPAGNVTSVSDAPTTTAVASHKERQCFTYDGMRRLTDGWSTTAAACQAAGSVSQAVVGGPSPFWQQFAYDAVGNRTQKVVRTAAGATTTVNSFGPATAGPHRRVQAQTTSPSGVVTTTGFAFDGAGNQTSTMVGANQKTLGWDAEGELTSVTGGGTNDSNVFDASGNRLIRSDASGSTVYLPGGTEVTVSPTNVVSVVRWYSFGGKTVAYRTGAGSAKQFSVFTDHQGSPVGSILNTNWAGGITRTRTDPFGAARSTVTSTAGHGFLAAPVDTTGLVSLGARYYDPDAGRFVSTDPVLSPLNTAQFNAYDYAGSNPLTWSDASGMDFWSDLGKNVSNGWNAAGKWVKKNASTLVGIAAGGLVTAGCLALTAGAGSVGCFVAGGMVGGAVSNLYKTTVQKKKFSLNSFVSDVAWGGAAGLLGPIAGAVGKAIAPAARSLIASLKKPAQALASRASAATRVTTPKTTTSNSSRSAVTGSSSSLSPGAWGTATESMSARSAAYQARVTGQPVGSVYRVNGVKFDGYAQGILQEAKGPGYASFVRNGQFQPWFNGADGLVSQAQRQLAAAQGVPITWSVAEANAVTAIDNLFMSRGISGISLIHAP